MADNQNTYTDNIKLNLNSCCVRDSDRLSPKCIFLSKHNCCVHFLCYFPFNFYLKMIISHSGLFPRFISHLFNKNSQQNGVKKCK